MAKVYGLQTQGRRKRPTPEDIIEQAPTWPVSRFQPNETQNQLLVKIKEKDIIIYSGGNFGGKTIMAVWLAVAAALGFFSWCPVPADIALVGLSQKQAKASFMRYLKLFIPDMMVMNRTKRDGLWSHIDLWNGSTIDVLTCLQGEDLHQGARRSLIIYDEEPPEAVVEEGLFRYREDMESRVVFTMTPTHGQSWLYHKYVKNTGKAEDGGMDVATVESTVFQNCKMLCKKCQINYMNCDCKVPEVYTPVCPTCNTNREKWDKLLMYNGVERNSENWIARQIIGSKRMIFSHKDLYCGHCWTFGVEPTLQKNKIQNNLNRVGDPKRIAMRYLGRWERVNGASCFFPEQIDLLRRFARKGIREAGSMTTFLPPMPGETYGVAIDPARGTGRDETAISVQDFRTGEQTAVWGDNESKFTDYMYDLLEITKQYQNGIIWAEYASGGEGLIPMLAKMPDLKFYCFQTRNKKFDMNLRGVDKIGWKPGEANRSRLLMQLIRAINLGMEQTIEGKWVRKPGVNGAMYPNDPKTIDQLEMLFYNDEKNGKIMVPEGKNDDRIIALAGNVETRISRGGVYYSEFDPVMEEIDRKALYHEQRIKVEGNDYDPWGID